VFYIFYGPDRFTADETIAAMRRRLAEEDPAAALNDLSLDGRSLTLADLRGAADALPFLGERRLVVVQGLLTRCQGRGADGRSLADGLVAYLPDLPPSTRLVLADGPLDAKNPVLAWAQAWLGAQPQPEAAAVVRCFEAPKPARLPAWLERRAAGWQGEIAPDAAESLAEAITREGVVDLGVASSELEKLLTYAGDRPVTVQDVTLLVTRVDIERVYALLDALSDRQAARALAVLHRFLDEGEPPLYLLAMIGRQFRTLATARALLDQGVPASGLGKHLKVPPFAVGKVARQAGHFSSAELAAALRTLGAADADVKSGRMDAVLALDLYVANVCGRTAAGPTTGRRQAARSGAPRR
jgi:DNA polymerase-3 subunit delta